MLGAGNLCRFNFRWDLYCEPVDTTNIVPASILRKRVYPYMHSIERPHYTSYTTYEHKLEFQLVPMAVFRIFVFFKEIWLKFAHNFILPTCNVFLLFLFYVIYVQILYFQCFIRWVCHIVDLYWYGTLILF